MSIGCQSDEEVLCKALIKSSETELRELDEFSLSELKLTVGTLKKTHQTCEAAGKKLSAGDALEAISNLQIQIQAIEKGKIPKDMEARERAQKKLILSGDPECPKGQGYKALDGKNVIQCTGVQAIQLTRNALDSRILATGARSHKSSDGKQVTQMMGTTRVAYFFNDDTTTAQCIVATNQKETPWQVLTSQVTGVQPGLLKKTATLSLPKRTVAFELRETGQMQVILLGECDEVNVDEILALPLELKSKPKPSTKPTNK